MANTQPDNSENARRPLDAERVLRGAVELADGIGIEAFTIRKLATHLAVKPMTIYHHVPNKEAIIDGMVDLVFAEIALPPADVHWQVAIKHRCISARVALARHRWAPPLMEARTSPGLATLRHHDAVLGCLRGGGLSLELTAHAYAAIDSYLYGFAMQEVNLPFDEGGDLSEFATAIMADFPIDAFPHLAEFTSEYVLQPGYSFASSFEFGLDLLLDGFAAASASG